jgi:hypothetical protein
MDYPDRVVQMTQGILGEASALVVPARVWLQAIDKPTDGFERDPGVWLTTGGYVVK